MNVNRIARSTGRFLPPIVATLLVILGLLAAIWMLAREPRSMVRIEVRDEYPVNVHEQVLRSEEILEPIIKSFRSFAMSSPDGSPSWMKELQVQHLARSIEVRGISKSDFLEVSFYHPDPQFASNMANAIVAIYAESRVNEVRKEKQQYFARARSDLKEMGVRLASLRRELAELKERGGIVDPDPVHEVAIKEGFDENSIVAYSVAKARFLTEESSFEAAKLKFASEIGVGCELEREPVRIWEKAEPSKHQPHADLRRLWKRLVPSS